MLVQRWSMLRAPMPCNFSITKIIALVNALAKLQNFCIDEQECAPDSDLNVDHEYMMSNKGGYIGMVSNDTHDIPIPEGLMDCSHHFQDVPRAYWRAWSNSHLEAQLPEKIMHDKVVSMHYCRPYRVTK
jgi:hypothetical protein